MSSSQHHTDTPPAVILSSYPATLDGAHRAPRCGAMNLRAWRSIRDEDMEKVGSHDETVLPTALRGRR